MGTQQLSLSLDVPSVRLTRLENLDAAILERLLYDIKTESSSTSAPALLTLNEKTSGITEISISGNLSSTNPSLSALKALLDTRVF